MDTNTVQVISDFGNKLDGYVAALASKAGVAVDHFYPMFVRQQAIEGWMGLADIAMCAVGFLIALKVLFMSLPTDSDTNRYGNSDPTPKKITGMVVGSIAALIMFFATMINCGSLTTDINKINNPEYYAVQALVNMVK